MNLPLKLSSSYAIRLVEVVLAVAVFVAAFIPLSSYWQNLETDQAFTLFSARSDSSAICNGPNIPVGTDINQYLKQYAIPAHGFPFQSQAGGTCVPDDNQTAIALNYAAAAVVACTAAAAFVVLAHVVMNGRGAHVG